MKYLILLVVFCVALVHCETVCDKNDENDCKLAETSCKWCPGLGCAQIPNVDIDPCSITKPEILPTNDCPNRKTSEVCTAISDVIKSVACSWCNEACVPTASLGANTGLTSCPIDINPCLKAADDKACLAITGVDASISICQWCPTFGCVKNDLKCPEPVSTCKECDPTTRPERICSDGSLMQSECDTTTCSWKPIETDICKFNTKCPDGCGFTTLEARICADGVTVAGKICNAATCAFEWRPCPGCEKLCTDKPTLDYTTQPCADGSQAGPVCDVVKCDWFYRPCPIIDTPLCKNGNVPVRCYANPCDVNKCNNPLAKFCEADYCNGGCDAIWYSETFEKVTCPVNARDCTIESNCEGSKPTTDKCADPKVYCAAGLFGGCEWRAICPDILPNPCDPTTCGGTVQSTDSKIACPSGEGSWVCNTQNLPFTPKDIDPTATNDANIQVCDWGWDCPPPKPDPSVCVVGGACGNECVAVAKNLPMDQPVVSQCKKLFTCEDNCFLTYVKLDSCGPKNDGTCSFDFDKPAEYGYCLKKCADPNTPPIENPCKGDICSCDYNNCGYCSRKYTTMVADAAFVQEKTECIRLDTPCINEDVIKASLTVKRPELCFANPVAITNDGTDKRPEIVKQVDNIDPVKIQDQLVKLSNTVPEVKDFIVSIKEQFTPLQNVDGSVKVSIVVTVSGGRDPTSNEQDIICRKVVLEGVQKVLNANDAKVTLELKNCDKLVTTTTKRAITQTGSSSYHVGMAGTASVPPGGANSSTSALFVSLVAFLVAILALLF